MAKISSQIVRAVSSTLTVFRRKTLQDLQVKTRDGSEPQGKPRAYFACHPDDFDLYFDVLSKEIFESQDCAIYYRAEQEEIPDKVAAAQQLDQMQLVIVPVTTNFLSRENAARDFEYGYAIEKNIPVLPILMEEGLDGKLVEVVEKIQPYYSRIHPLSRVMDEVSDETYKKKLKRRLDAVLVGVTRAEAVRSAYDAYLFIRFRHADPDNAKKLQEMISDIPLLENVTFWYDRVMLPDNGDVGELSEAMKSSAMVVVAVTPAMVLPEEKDADVTEETPEEGTILRAQILPSDAESLSEMFYQIPRVVDGENPDAVRAALQSAVENVVSKHTDTPERSYLRGLAYLRGIDVQRDRSRALKLITAAADKEYPPAVKKLSDMYYEGDGVPVNDRKSAVYMAKYLDIRKKRYERERNEENALLLLDAYYLYATMLRDMGELYRAADLFRESYELSMEMTDQFRTSEFRMHTRRSCKRLGDIAEKCSDLDEAKKYYERAMEISRTYYELADTLDSCRRMCISYDQLGNLAMEMEDYEAARDYFTKMLSVIEEYTYRASTETARIAMARTNNNLGKVCEAQGDYLTAVVWYERGLEVLKTGFEVTDSAREYRLMGENYDMIGDAKKLKGDFAGAQASYEKAMEIREILAKNAKTVRGLRDLGLSYKKMETLAIEQGKASAAKKWNDKYKTLYAKEP